MAQRIGELQEFGAFVATADADANARVAECKRLDDCKDWAGKIAERHARALSTCDQI